MRRLMVGVATALLAAGGAWSVVSPAVVAAVAGDSSGQRDGLAVEHILDPLGQDLVRSCAPIVNRWMDLLRHEFRDNPIALADVSQWGVDSATRTLWLDPAGLEKNLQEQQRSYQYFGESGSTNAVGVKVGLCIYQRRLEQIRQGNTAYVYPPDNPPTSGVVALCDPGWQGRWPSEQGRLCSSIHSTLTLSDAGVQARLSIGQSAAGLGDGRAPMTVCVARTILDARARRVTLPPAANSWCGPDRMPDISAAYPGRPAPPAVPPPKPAPPPPPKPKPTASTALDDVLKGLKTKDDPRRCREAIAYVESPDGLLGEYDRAVAKADIRHAYERQLTAIKKDLLDDTWWARSAVADVAREAKFLSDVIVQIYAIFTPSGRAVEAASSMPGWYLENFYGNTEVQIFTKLTTRALAKGALEAADKADNVAGVVKSAYDRREDVWAAARGAGAKAAEIAAEEVLKHALAKKGVERLFPAYKLLKAVYERAHLAKEAAELKETVKVQLERIERALDEVEVQIASDRRTVRAINDIRDVVVRSCSQGPGL